MMSTYFDYLPTADVIHECIFPYLDYESRIQFNRALPPVERFSRRLAAHALAVHDYCVQYDRMGSYVKNLMNCEKPIRKRCQILIKILSGCQPTGRSAILLQHNIPLRHAVINKCLAIADPANDVLNSASPYYKKKIRRIASDVLPEILDMTIGFPMIRRDSYPIQIL